MVRAHAQWMARRSGASVASSRLGRGGRKGRDPAFNHATGKGFVAEAKGDYYDALVVKKSRVIPVIIEVYGGITPHTLAHIGHLARRAKGKGARDSTKYGLSRTSTKSFFAHHTQRIALAAQLHDAIAIRKEIGSRKQRLLAASRIAGGAP